MLSRSHGTFISEDDFLSIHRLGFLETRQSLQGEGEPVAEIWNRDELVKWGGYGEEKLSTVVISGKLLCHVGPDDDKLSRHPYPISGATVAVLCGTSGRKRDHGQKAAQTVMENS
ncbi:hypothetical protein DH2020_033033 [Rehmannia glutinosa]|uniref:Uncharacterized protein n=1 Tax=Rehmannia glutinosa TaxID=99300 RepID=A0ABR0VGR4_REHGL